MKIVLDTNILLQSIAHASRFRPIWNSFLVEFYAKKLSFPKVTIVTAEEFLNLVLHNFKVI
jgi:hypothetical protein